VGDFSLNILFRFHPVDFERFSTLNDSKSTEIEFNGNVQLYSNKLQLSLFRSAVKSQLGLVAPIIKVSYFDILVLVKQNSRDIGFY
jgi:hypothetical protein